MHLVGAVATREPPSVLVGRTDELATISAELAASRGGTARVVLVTGEPGIGKTALCRTAVSRATGFRVLHAAGEPSERDLVYGVVDQLIATVSDRPAARLGATPLAVGAALLQMISDLETHGPVLLWVDDLHWADPPSQAALLFLLRRLEADPALVLLCDRDDTGAALVPGLARLLGGEGCRRLALEGLSEDDLGAMAEAASAALPRSAVRRLHQHTSGNPLWAMALMRETPPERLLDVDGRLPAPRTFSAIVAKRLDRLSPAARGLVEACAVAGNESSLGLLDRVAPTGASFAALHEAVEAHLLRSSESTPPVVAPAHTLVASAVYDRLDPSRRAALHAALAREAPTEHDRLRHEIAASPGHDGALSARVAAAASAAAAGGAFTVAANMYRSAARLSPTTANRRDLLQNAMAAALMGGNAEHAAAFRNDLADLPGSPRRDSLLGWLGLVQGKYEEAERLLMRAVHIAQDASETVVVAEASRMLAHLLVIRGRADEAVAYGRRALALDPPRSMEAGTARGNLVVALAHSGLYAAALQECAHIDQREMAPDELVPVLARAGCRLLTGDFEAAADELSAVIESSRAVGYVEPLIAAWAQLSDAQYRLGDWDNATDNAEQAVRLADDGQQTWAIARVHAIASLVPARRGDGTTAARHVNRARKAAARTRETMSVGYAETAAAVLAHSRGAFDDARTSGRRILGLEHRGSVDLPGAFEWQPLYAEALVRTGRLGEAQDFVTRLQETSDRVRLPWPMAGALGARGLLLAAQGRVEEAVTDLAGAHALFVRAGAPFHAALVDLHHGQVLRGQGHRKDAVVVLARGLATFTRLRAAPFADLAVQELSAAGVNGKVSPRVRASHLLTRQELAVSRLVGNGLSNREIAAQLFISTKTVEFHLVNAYRKLGVSSRTQLVRRLARD